jgi:hypothetical protein
LNYWQDGESVRVHDLDTFYVTLPFNMMQRHVFNDSQSAMQFDLPTGDLVERSCDFDPLARFSALPTQLNLDSPVDVYLYGRPIRQSGGQLDTGTGVIVHDVVCSVAVLNQTPACFWNAEVDTKLIWIETDCGIASG